MFVGTVMIGNYGDVFTSWFSLHLPINSSFQPWQIITHMFMHQSFAMTTNGMSIYLQHLLFNMVLLLMIGPMVEASIGKMRFLFLYIIAGIGSALIATVVDYVQFSLALNSLIAEGFSKPEILDTLNSGMINTGWERVMSENQYRHLVVNFNKYSLGASGAIMGVMAVFGLMFPERRVMLLIPPIPIKVKYLVVGLIGSDLLSAIFTGTPLLGHSNTGYVAHLGGALTGALVFLYWKKTQFNNNRWDR